MDVQAGPATLASYDAPTVLMGEDGKDMDNTPQVIGGCRILKKLGQGGMGAVYRAEHQTLGRQVALKLLPAEFSQNTESVQRFLREARAAAQLQHPNIVPVYDAGEQGGQYYISMALVEGASLAAMVKQVPYLTEPVGLAYLEQAATGLAVAHAAGLVHRDIKPDNMLVGHDGILKIADFGLVSDGAGASGLTQTGAMLGTPTYMSPEQCEGRKADARSDLYSLGAAFYKILTGDAPFVAPTPIAVLFKHAHEPTPDPRSKNPALSEQTAQILLRLMAKKPEERFQNAQELVIALAPIRQVLQQAQTPGPPHFAGIGPGAGSGLNPVPTPAPSSAAWTPAPVGSGATPPGSQSTPSLPPTLPPANTPANMQATPMPANMATPMPSNTPMPVAATSLLTPMPTQPPPRSKTGKVLVAMLLVALLGAGGFFGHHQYHENKIDEAKQQAIEQKSLHQYEVAIQTLDAAYAEYPEREELKRMRDAFEVEYIQRQVGQLKDGAREQIELGRYEEAIKGYDSAISLMDDRATLPGLVPDPKLIVLKKKARDLWDFSRAMDAGRKAEEAKEYDQAVASYREAERFDVPDVREAKAGIVRASYHGLMTEAATHEEGRAFEPALAALERAAVLKFQDVSADIRRLQTRIKHRDLLQTARKQEADGKRREAAATYRGAAKLAEGSAATELSKRANALSRDADFDDVVGVGQRALKDKDWKSAQKTLREALGIKAKDPLAERLLVQAQVGEQLQKGTASEKAGDWAGAKEAYRKAQTYDPRNKMVVDRVQEIEKLIQNIARLDREAREAKAKSQWDVAIKKLAELELMDFPNKERYARLAAVARFDKTMATARERFNAGDLKGAVALARRSMTYDPTGGKKAQALIDEANAKMAGEKRAAELKSVKTRVYDLVKGGNVRGAMVMLDKAIADFPNDQELMNLRGSLAGVDAFERAIKRLSEIAEDAKASSQVSLNQKDDKKVRAWHAEIAAWSGKVDGQRGLARSAWLEREPAKIRPAFDSMKATAREMAQSFSSLAAKFHGKAADTAKPKFRIGGVFGGGRGGRYGGFGGGHDVGGNSKRAEIYRATANTLTRCAAQARTLGASR